MANGLRLCVVAAMLAFACAASSKSSSVLQPTLVQTIEKDLGSVVPAVPDAIPSVTETGEHWAVIVFNKEVGYDAQGEMCKYADLVAKKIGRDHVITFISDPNEYDSQAQSSGANKIRLEAEAEQFKVEAHAAADKLTEQADKDHGKDQDWLEANVGPLKYINDFPQSPEAKARGPLTQDELALVAKFTPIISLWVKYRSKKGAAESQSELASGIAQAKQFCTAVGADYSGKSVNAGQLMAVIDGVAETGKPAVKCTKKPCSVFLIMQGHGGPGAYQVASATPHKEHDMARMFAEWAQKDPDTLTGRHVEQQVPTDDNEKWIIELDHVTPPKYAAYNAHDPSSSIQLITETVLSEDAVSQGKDTGITTRRGTKDTALNWQALANVAAQVMEVKNEVTALFVGSFFCHSGGFLEFLRKESMRSGKSWEHAADWPLVMFANANKQLESSGEMVSPGQFFTALLLPENQDKTLQELYNEVSALATKKPEIEGKSSVLKVKDFISA